MTRPTVQVTGLNEFKRGLRDMDRELPKALRVALNTGAEVIVDDARPRVERRTGRAASTVKARSTQNKARVVGGGNRAPYYPWLDFGGRVGRGRGVDRPFLTNGRYIYDAFFRRRDEFVDVMRDELLDVARTAGIEVT